MPVEYSQTRNGAEKQPLDEATINAAANRIVTSTKARVRVNPDGSFVIHGLDPATLFSPQQPLQPANQDPRFGAVGRRYDYQPGINTFYTPRGDQTVSFKDLRLLARNYDLLRTVIETRKDQMDALDWRLAFVDDKKPNNDLKTISALLKFPDGHHPYISWMRACLEEVFVTDSLTMYPVKRNDGSLFSFEQIDGTLIKPLIDAQGRSPDPPSPAYQQIIKGLPAVDYTRDELVYWPRNVRVETPYGFSPVEQIIVSVNIALRRQVFQLDYYRMGSIPDAMVGVPDNWTGQDIKTLQEYWDAKFLDPLAENTGQRRKLTFMPGGKVTFSKDAALKDEFDEWLARIVCFAFSIEPTPFIKQMNRSTAGTQKEASREEGLLPLKKWWKAFMDFLIAKYIGRPDIEFVWDDDESVDAETKSKIDVEEVGAGILTADEVRAERGLPALPQPIETQPRMPTTEQLDPSAGAPPQNPGSASNAPAPKGGEPAVKPAESPTAKYSLPVGSHAMHVVIKTIERRFTKAGMPVNAEYIVPLGFGISIDGGTIYRSKNIPQMLDVDGKMIDLDETCSVHELVEFNYCKADGATYLEGHQVANSAEHALVAAQFIDPARYEQVLAPFLDEALQAGKAGAVTPPDLAPYPYVAEGIEAILRPAPAGEVAEQAEKAAKPVDNLAKVNPPLPRQQIVQGQRMARAVKRQLRSQARSVIEQVGQNLSSKHSASAIMDTIDWKKVFEGFPSAVADPLKKMAADAVKRSQDSVNKALAAKMRKDSSAGVTIAPGFVNDWSLQYAMDRGAELVGMKYDAAGNLIENPDAQWAISDDTRAGVQRMLEQAISDGWTLDEFADALTDSYAFSSDRADMIARTETRLADSKGTLAGWKESGVVEKKVWLVSNDGCCDDCQENADEGEIALDDDFPSGDDAPPAHPNCRCVVSPVVSNEED